MNISNGHWHVVLSERELRGRPVGKRRFGEQFVFWRDSRGQVACLLDRCPHRGAALSLGRLQHGTLACPYHGFRFDGQGRCVAIPAEGDRPIPDHFHGQPVPVRESQGFVWMWRGPALDADRLPPVPIQPVGDRTSVYAECTQQWPAHFTRCVEGVIDHSHLPFVHRKTLGLFTRDPVTHIRVELIEDGFRTNLMRGDEIRHHVDLTYPNIWTQSLNPAYSMSAAFAPIDDRSTEVYCRLHHTLDWPPARAVMALWNRFSQYMVFHEDLPILASQDPSSVDGADAEKLLPSDAAQLQYRRMRKKILAELAGHSADAALTSD